MKHKKKKKRREYERMISYQVKRNKNNWKRLLRSLRMQAREYEKQGNMEFTLDIMEERIEKTLKAQYKAFKDSKETIRNIITARILGK